MLLTVGQFAAPVDLVVLDKDGTMFDLDEAWAGVAAVWEERLERASGIPGLAGAIAHRIGHDRATGDVAFGSVLAAGTMQQLRDVTSEVIANHRGDPTIVDAVALPDAGSLTPKGDLAGWLSRVRQFGARVAVLTSDDRVPTLEHIEDAGVAGMVDDLVAGDDELPPKPDPAGLLALCNRFGVEPACAVMIGDSPGDMEAAQAAGTRRIGIRAPTGHAPAGAEVIVDSLDEIELAP